MMLIERMSALEKRMENKNSEMMKILQFINTRVSVNPPVHNSILLHPMQVQQHLDPSYPGFRGSLRTVLRGVLYSERGLQVLRDLELIMMFQS